MPLLTLGRIAESQKDYPAAELYAQRALEIQRKHDAPKDLELTSYLSLLASYPTLTRPGSVDFDSDCRYR